MVPGKEMRMIPAFLLCLCLLGLSFAAPKERTVRWCVTSDNEDKTCNDLANSCFVGDIHLKCVKKSSTEDCMTAISNGEADAMSLDGGDVYKTSSSPFNLKPIMSESHHYQKEIQGPCHKDIQHLLKEGQPLLGKFVPKCDEEGNYHPKQCHGSTGYCWCVNEAGKEINGTKTPPGESPKCGEEKNTHCIRQRRRVLGKKKHKMEPYVPVCDEKGHYEPMQCHGSTGYCWCADKDGNELLAGRAKQGLATVTCDNTANEKSCLKKRQKAVSGEQPLLGGYIPDCDEDGNYSPQQCHGSTGYCWCVNEDGEEIPGSRTPPGEKAPTCGASGEAPCLRDRRKVMSAGQPIPGSFIPDCDEEGNYSPRQCHDSTGYCWCVTKDGEELADSRTAPGQLPPTCGVTDSVTVHYAVAVVKKSSTIQFNQLKGKRSCHSAVGEAAGWFAPLNALHQKKLLFAEGSEKKSIEKAASEFFSASCAPGSMEENLCEQCGGEEDKCKCSPGEPYYGNEGAFRCLRDDKGDVAFVEHIVLSDQYSDDYELLCPDNTRSPLSQHKDCNFGKVPKHAVVTRSTGDKTEDITEYLLGAQKNKCKLFTSQGTKSLFEDTTTKLIALPSAMDTALFLGSELYIAMKTLHGEPLPPNNEVRWCPKSSEEKKNCDDWSAVSGGAIKCMEPSSVLQCIERVLKGEADAVNVPSAHIYTALKCGLVPSVEEYRNQDDFTPCRTNAAKYFDFSTVWAVAVVKKKDKDITWNNLKGKKSCHTGVGDMAGWIIPATVISKKTKTCDIGSFFSQSCAPGADPDSNLCQLCIGDPENTEAKTKCSLSDKEAYYGNDGAIRCLVEKGDVAFVPSTAVLENTDGKNPALWAKDLKSSDFELLCPDGSRAPIGDSKNCRLPGHFSDTVVTREESASNIVQIILNQQSLYGRIGSQKDIFQMFSSRNDPNRLFSKEGQCLVEFDRIYERNIMDDYFGKDHYKSPCLPTSALDSVCDFHNG